MKSFQQLLLKWAFQERLSAIRRNQNNTKPSSLHPNGYIGRFSRIRLISLQAVATSGIWCGCSVLMLGSDWHTSKQKVYYWPSNKSELLLQHDRLASSRPSHAIRETIGTNSGPLNHSHGPTALATDLRLSCDVLRPISNRSTTWGRPPRVTCVTRQKFAWDKENSRVTCDRFTTVPKDIRGHQMDYYPPARTSSYELGHSQLKLKVPRPFLMVKSDRGACRFQWRVGPSYSEYSRVTYDLLVSNIVGTYDIADQLPK